MATDIKDKLLSGAIAGVLSRTAVAPVERVIIVKQTQVEQYKGNHTCFNTLSLMRKNEGIKSWFKGNFANCVRIAPFQAIEFFMFDTYKSIYTNNFHKYLQLNRVTLDLFTGALAGMTASACVYPLDLVKTHIAINTQTGRNPGIVKTLKDIVMKEGVRGMYKGLSATMVGMAPYASLKLTFYNNLQYLVSKSRNEDQKKMPVWVNLALGGLAGCLAVTITYPTDLIRRNLQVMKMNKDCTSTYKSVIVKIIQKDGILGLYTGLPSTYLKLLPSTALVFAINDFLKQIRPKD